MSMDPQIKSQWVAALRSGRYPQAPGALRSQYGFCCLGVLCDVVDPVLWQESADGLYHYASTGRNYSVAYLPESLRVRINLEHDIEGELASKNDDGVSFENIADYIEKHL